MSSKLQLPRSLLAVPAAASCRLPRRPPLGQSLQIAQTFSKKCFLGLWVLLGPFSAPRNTFRCATAWRACEAAGPAAPAFVLNGLCVIVKTGRCAGQLSFMDLKLRHLHNTDPAGRATQRGFCPHSTHLRAVWAVLLLYGKTSLWSQLSVHSHSENRPLRGAVKLHGS